MRQKTELKPAFQLQHSFQGWQKIVTLRTSQHKPETKMDSTASWGKKADSLGKQRGSWHNHPFSIQSRPSGGTGYPGLQLSRETPTSHLTGPGA